MGPAGASCRRCRSNRRRRSGGAKPVAWPPEPCQPSRIRAAASFSRNRDIELGASAAEIAERRIGVDMRPGRTPDGLPRTPPTRDGVIATRWRADGRRPRDARARPGADLREQPASWGRRSSEAPCDWRLATQVPACLAAGQTPCAASRRRAGPRAAPSSRCRAAAVAARALPGRHAELPRQCATAGGDFYTRHGVRIIGAAYEANEAPSATPA